MATDITYDGTTLKASVVSIMLKGAYLLSKAIDVVIEEHEDWYGLINDDIDSQCRTLKERIYHLHSTKVISFAAKHQMKN